MAYLMDEINESATQRRLAEITTSGVRALEECAERSAEIDEQARESNARQEAEFKAMERERDEREREGAPAGEQQPAASVPWPTRESKPRVLSFAAEDFAEQANAPTPPTGFTEPTPAPDPASSASPVTARSPRDHLLSFAAEEDEVPPPEPPRPAPQAPPAPPARSRPPADLDDDDWSDQSWLR